ncbi:hypothetical protein FS749_003350 [Ceratobasidium sp. UAMH 11750]|nr:hypothetical protein FS749_003350 [Ceratobasidium sp. UAMH 11750]
MFLVVRELYYAHYLCFFVIRLGRSGSHAIGALLPINEKGTFISLHVTLSSAKIRTFGYPGIRPFGPFSPCCVKVGAATTTKELLSVSQTLRCEWPYLDYLIMQQTFT